MNTVGSVEESRGRRDSEGWRRPIARDARWFSTAQIFINPSLPLLCVLCAVVFRSSPLHHASFVSPRAESSLQAFRAASPRVGNARRAPSASPSPTPERP